MKGATACLRTEISPRIVSIHAPVKGATMAHIELKLKYNVSIHAPVKGATVLEVTGDALLDVSIHAPVKGATSWCSSSGP